MSSPVYATRSELYQYGVMAAALGSFVDTATQDAGLAAASRVADGYLGVVFTLPLTLWGEDLKQAVCSIAAYRLMGLRGFSPDQQDAPQFRDGYRDAIAWLTQVSQGKVKPINIKDSDADGDNNTDAAGNARQVPFVTQAESDSHSAGGFWRKDGISVTDGTLGAVRKRGW